MQQMSNLDYHFLAEELQRELAGGRFNKAYQTGDRRLRLKLHKEGERNLVIELGVRAQLSKFVEEGIGEQDAFISLLRRKLDNAVVEEISQLNFDRIIEFRLRKDQTFYLVLEMLGKGNALLLDADRRIIDAFEREEYSSRSLKPKREYVLPPSEKIHPSKVKAGDLAGLKGKLVSVLSKKIGAAPFYLEEACARAGLERGSAADKLSDKQAEKLVSALHSLLKKCEPVVYFKEGVPFAFAPFPLEKLAGDATLSIKQFGSFSEALDEYYSAASPAEQRTAKKPVSLLKLEHAFAQQEKAAVEMEKLEAEERAKASLVSSNLQVFEQVIVLANKLKKEKKPLHEIEKSVNEVLSDYGLRCSMRKHDELVIEEK